MFRIVRSLFLLSIGKAPSNGQLCETAARAMHVHRICLLCRPLLYRCDRSIHGRKGDKQSLAINVDPSPRKDENVVVDYDENSRAVEEKKKVNPDVEWVLKRDKYAITECERNPLAPEPELPTNIHEIPWSTKWRIAMKEITPSTNYLAWLQTKWDNSPGSLRRWAQRRIYMQMVREQQFVPERYGRLGADLSAATFVLELKGKVQFNEKDWVTDVKLLPRDYNSAYKVTAIQTKNLLYEGIDNLIQLKHLKHLNVSNNILLDDWCCDILSRVYRQSRKLETIDISGCKRITDKGIQSLLAISSLKRLNITGTKASEYEFIELLVILMNDINPNCEIIYENPKLLEEE